MSNKIAELSDGCVMSSVCLARAGIDSGSYCGRWHALLAVQLWAGLLFRSTLCAGGSRHSDAWKSCGPGFSSWLVSDRRRWRLSWTRRPWSSTASAAATRSSRRRWRLAWRRIRADGSASKQPPRGQMQRQGRQDGLPGTRHQAGPATDREAAAKKGKERRTEGCSTRRAVRGSRARMASGGVAGKAAANPQELDVLC